MGPVGNNKQVLFLGYDPASPEPTGYELWTTDGTEAGTKILKDIAPNSENGVSMYWLSKPADYMRVKFDLWT